MKAFQVTLIKRNAVNPESEASLLIQSDDATGEELSIFPHQEEHIHSEPKQSKAIKRSNKRGGRRSQRDSIITYALSLAHVHGPKKFTLEKLAEVAGISKGGILYHFPSMSDLVWAMLNAYLSKYLEDYNSMRRRELDINTISVLTQSVPVNPNIEALFLKNALEKKGLPAGMDVLRGLIEKATSAEKIELYAAVGRRAARLYGLLDEDI